MLTDTQKSERDWAVYAKRDSTLRAMGFASYQAYLQSDLWKEVRVVVLQRDHGKCTVCSRPATSVHHTRYTKDVLCGDDLTGLRSICGRCHRGIEFSRNEKNTLRCANKRMRRFTKKQAIAALRRDDRSFRDLEGLVDRVRLEPNVPSRSMRLIALKREINQRIKARVIEGPGFAAG